MAIPSNEVPESGPPARTRGVRWDKSAPAGYKRLSITNSAGLVVKIEEIHESLLDGGEIARAWALLEEKCPESDIEPQPLPIARPALYLMA